MIGNKNILVVFFGCILVSGMYSAYAQEGKYGGQEKKSDMEDIKWEENIEFWDIMANEWEEERMKLHGNNFDDDDREYCSEKGCWQEEMTRFTFTGLDGKELWEMDNNDSNAEIAYADGTKWENENTGQVLIFIGIGKEYWRSDNFGQVIEYIDSEGNRWKNTSGQVVTYEGVDGEKWENTNDGQVLEYTNAQGESWEGDDGGIEYESADGQEWDSDDFD